MCNHGSDSQATLRNYRSFSAQFLWSLSRSSQEASGPQVHDLHCKDGETEDQGVRGDLGLAPGQLGARTGP